ncbi:HAE1 family hydrophobic/amphiphilic exporter-1 [Parabacteroides sp. PF5-5]|uniref:efflux RND transporter permease subunit n=1 Tax=unclassified Parabacteroides TaxID=2649774 RepID=UPI002476EE6B|nr:MULTISPECIES: efflux RND transporter permease subunit [unclassified Parabacteroides]MDH6303614.1 HAE1 family hydrophobic/amphiphilic exporter-1 [Parabacteroides sp. PH5-39]MDH6314936.1 HAE1 family hydrophobic/amphiphilic exporter-1 [Parabacteroides sp. PF5-13]MDH6318273.1 HAE1 family hydrophobic/amphiphilic exporter-1 [Parabacteroides sp. PH5-13]MDH6321794.1 HAE1 family hydrophobic/amphiphilic exporter-1 [Parabacteroides sp. PH5-8]MDH6325918.1 HAE1 family hydrophobic/amphiphilic exporter-1 
MTIKTFIDRPILSMVISVIILLVGFVALKVLPVEQYPDIAPPTVMVRASYTGANAETVQKSVIVPLEESINGVENMTYMTSEATNDGAATIYIYFRQGTDPDMAAVNVQNRVSKATGLLPGEVTQIGVTTIKRQNSILKIFSLYSPDDTYDQTFLANYLKINIQPEILRIQGVGEVVILGSDYSMRIWLKPDVMAQYKLVPADVAMALGEQNIESPTGTLGENSSQTFQYVMKYKGRLEHPEEFGDIVIRSLPNGEILRLKDIATVELGALSYTIEGQTNGHPGASAMIFQVAGSNANDVITNIDNYLASIEKDLPKGVAISHLMSSKDFLDASIAEVIKTLLEAILLVILIVYVFLQSFRATIIPSISIIVSLVGTFACLIVMGFSINLLTLFALILCIGTVVDDAIVVVEAVQAKFDAGYKSPYLATVDAMGEITAAIISCTLVFMAVFIPVSFMTGTSGTFYTQFGLTMAVAIGISCVNALTLSPALCALIMRPHADGEEKKSFSQRFHIAFEAAFEKIQHRYKNGVMVFIRHKWLVGVILVGASALLLVLMKTTKTGLVPQEDTGVFFVDVSTAPGSTLRETKEVMGKIEYRLQNFPQVQTYAKVSGSGMISGDGTSHGMFIVKLKHWDDRPDKEDHVNALIGRLYAETADIKDAQIFAFAPPMITGYGQSNGIELYLQDKKGSELGTFYNISQEFIAKLRERPEIGAAYTSFNINYPQYLVDVDAVKCKRMGVSPSDVLSAISGYYGGLYASNFNRFTKMYRVLVQASPEYRLDTESLNNIFVRSGSEMAPVGQFVTLTKVYGSESVSRFNMFNSIAVNGMPADGYSTGEAIQAIAEVASATLPVGYGYDYGGITREETGDNTGTIIVFGICVLLIYLILCGLYESVLIPLAVILSIPCGLAGSFLFAKLMGLENNIYLQTGLIMLIGLLSKTAILLTEYATERRRCGMSLIQSALSAATVRLRPILMTALTMIFGLLPLVFATGVGAQGNISLGVGTVGGMLVGTLALLFLVPTLFIVFQYLQEKVSPPKLKELDDHMISTEIDQYNATKL